MFADVCDYTTLAEATDPEDADSIKRKIEELASTVIRRHGGTISQVYGDGILAVFGFPQPREDDARGAIEAALELHDAIRGARWDEWLPFGFQVRMHSGVHAGLVFSRRGDALHGRYELTGDAVNTAARLCSAAGRDEILVSGVALRGFDAFFSTRPATQMNLRGKALSVPAQIVTGRSGLQTSFEARSRRGLTAFSGRKHELAQVQLAIDESENARGALILVQGDAGIGKSRLLEEVLRAAIARGSRVLHGCCDSYGETGPLEPFVHVLRQAFELPPDHDTEASIAAVDQRLACLPVEVAQHRATLLRLMSLLPWPDGVAELRAFTAEVIRAITDLICALSVEAPIVLALDDWHWADDASRQVLAGMCEAFNTRRVCTLVGMRRGIDAQMLPTPSLVLSLQPFTADESAQVVRGLRPMDFDRGLTPALHTWSGGNPLFLEELCRSLPDRLLDGPNALDPSQVPYTLQGVIQARVAALPPSHLRVLCAAAVIGIEFSSSLVSRVLQADALEPELEALLEQDLIYRGEQPGFYRFKHGITREVIYESVRIGERRQMHRLVAAAIELQATDTIARSEALSYHHRQAGNYEQAANYAEAAGDKAMKASSLDRARFHYAAAMTALDRLATDDDRMRRWLAISAKWANPSSYSPTRDQLRILERAYTYATTLNDDAARAQTDYFVGWFHYVFGDFEPCVQAYERALALATATQNLKLEAQLWSTLGQAHAASGNYEVALPWLIRGIEHKRTRSEARRHRAWNLAHALGCKALVHADRGEFVQAGRDFEEAFEIVAGTGHAMEASLLAHHAMSHMRQGLWQACGEVAARARATAARTNSSYVLAMSEVFEARARMVLNPSDDALSRMDRALGWLEARHHGLDISVAYSCAAEAHLAGGDSDEASRYAAQALERAERGDPLGEAAAYRVLAKIHAAATGMPARSQVEAYLDAARRSGERRGSPREAALTALSSQELDSAHFDVPVAPERVRALVIELDRMHMPWYAERARSLLGTGRNCG